MHYLHVTVPRRTAPCKALAAALAQLETTPGRAQRIARRGQQLVRGLTTERVHGYLAGVLRAAAAAFKPDVLRSYGLRASPAALVTKRNFRRHLSEATRPWIERVFLPANDAGNLSGRTAQRAHGGRSFAVFS